MENIGAIVVVTAIAVAATWYLTRLFLSKDIVARSDYDALNNEKQKLAVQCEMSRAALSKAETALQDAQKQLMQSVEVASRLEAEKASLTEKLQQHTTALQETEQKFRLEFENLANRIFEEKTTKFKADSAEGLGNLLNPLKEQIRGFNEKVEQSFGEQVKEQITLKTELKNLALGSEKLTQETTRIMEETARLTKALKGDSKVQGDLGEMLLENTLQDAGFREGEDYHRQSSGLGLKDTETGAAIRPDFVIDLPDSKHVIADSKVSLKSYEAYSSAETDTDRALHLKAFMASVKQHIDDLSKKRYQHAEGLNTPDFVLMFLPYEGAYMLAMQQDNTLHNYAWEKGIIIVCRPLLMATLRTIQSLWRLEKQNKNANDIAKRAGALYDKLAGVVDAMGTLKTNIEKTASSYGVVMDRLSTGNGNAVRQVEMLKQLGAKTSKSMPVALLADETGDAEEDTVEASNVVAITGTDQG